MTNVLENNMQDFEFQQKRIIMMGGIVNQQKQKLSPEAIKQMKKDYVKMYYGFTSINWGMGKTLGMSWQKALEQMDGFVSSKVKIANHPANDELMKFHTDFRRDMAKAIMTSPYVEDKLSEKTKQSFLDYGQKAVQEAKSSLDNMYKKYMPQQKMENSANANKFDIANQKTKQMMQILMMQRLNQRTA